MFNELFSLEPSRYQRYIISVSTNDLTIREQESEILKTVNARDNENYINQSNNDKKFICKFHSEKTKEKLKKSRIGKTPNKGKVFSSEWKNKIAEAGKGRIPWNKGKKGEYKIPKLNKPRPPFSNEHKRNISKALTGKRRSEEHCKKISEAQRKRHNSKSKTLVS